MSKTVLFQTIQFSSSTHFSSIWHIERDLVWVFCCCSPHPFAGPVHYHSPQSPAFIRNLLRGITICLSWDGDILANILMLGGFCGVMVIIVGNGHDNLSSKHERDCLYFTIH